MRELPVTGTQDQSFCILVEPSCDMEHRSVGTVGEEHLIRQMSSFVYLRTHISCGLMQQQSNMFFDGNTLSFVSNHLSLGNFHLGLYCLLTIHKNEPLFDDTGTLTTGDESKQCKILIKTY